MGQRTELRLARQQAYLAHLALTGSIQDAAAAIGINPTTPGKWRRRYHEFAIAEQRAMKKAAKRLRDRLIHGSEMTIVHEVTENEL